MCLVTETASRLFRPFPHFRKLALLKMPFSFANAGKSHDAVNVSLNLSDDNSSGEEDMTRTATPIPDSAKVPKKKVAIILGYLGTHYQGMQV